jgi:multifunctional beta-oxidation protein
VGFRDRRAREGYLLGELIAAAFDVTFNANQQTVPQTAQACWPIFQAQKFGRVVTTASSVGLYGNFGQANYSTAKAAILGLTRTLAVEGAKYNIKVNCIAPSAGTAMTKTIWTQEMVDMFKPDYVAPVVGYLSSADCEDSGTIYEVFAGWAAQVRWERTGGFAFPNDKKLQPEDIVAKWGQITNFEDGRVTHPASNHEALQQILGNFENTSSSSSSGGSPYIDEEDTEEIKSAKSNPRETGEFKYDDRDVILYNLGIGARADELKWTYEGADDFGVLPTFGVIPPFGLSSGQSFDYVPNFNPAKLLHGEQYLKIFGPIPNSATLVSEVKLMEVLDKGKAATVTSITTTTDKRTGKPLFENQSTVMLRGSGGFGGKKTGKGTSSSFTLFRTRCSCGHDL